MRLFIARLSVSIFNIKYFGDLATDSFRYNVTSTGVWVVAVEVAGLAGIFIQGSSFSPTFDHSLTVYLLLVAEGLICGSTAVPLSLPGNRYRFSAPVVPSVVISVSDMLFRVISLGVSLVSFSFILATILITSRSICWVVFFIVKVCLLLIGMPLGKRFFRDASSP